MAKDTKNEETEVIDDEAAIRERVAKAKATQVDDAEGHIDDEYALAQANKSGSGTIAPALDLSRTLTVKDFKLPRLKLLQAMSKECKREDNALPHGTWYLEGNRDTLGKEAVVIPLFQYMNRSMMVPGQGPVCRSYDMIQGQGDPGILCADCSFKDWPKERGKGGPPCNEYYNYPVLVVIPDDDPQLGLMTLGRTSTDAAKMLNSFWANSVGNSWYTAMYRLGRELENKPKGSYYVATVTREGKTKGELLERAEQMVQTIDATAVRRAIEQDPTE
jgi:hypothetical protein